MQTAYFVNQFTLERTPMPLKTLIPRLLLAFVVGGAIGALAITGAATIVSYIPGAQNYGFYQGILLNLLFWPFFNLYTTPAAIIAGLPAYFIFRRLGMLNWFSATFTGAVAGFLVADVVGVNREWIYGFLIYPFGGVVAALVAYLVMLRSNIPLNNGRAKVSAPVS